MNTKQTKFVSYKPGPPESMFLDERAIEVVIGVCRHKKTSCL
jgi:hypothetical protein